MKNKIRSLITVAAIAAVGVMFTGCAATPLAQKPVTTHVVHIAGSGKKLGLVEDPVTGQYSLGYQSIFVGITTVPVTTAMNTNGTVVFITPDAVASYEIAAKNGIFGSGGSTYTVAVGQSAVATLLGGQHPPVNLGYWTNSATSGTVSLPTTANAAAQPAALVPSASK